MFEQRYSHIIHAVASDLFVALELDPGDAVMFRLRSGRVVALRLMETSASLLERVPGCSADYCFSARFAVDGEEVEFTRYVGSQACFHEPFVIDGLWLWLDTAAAVFDVVPVRYPRPGALRCVPRKALRIALQDAALRICPDELLPWMPTPRDAFDVADCYGGDDCYLGPYRGEACHVGMDMNAELGSPLFTPMRVDTQCFFHSLAAGDENNRWMGVRRWPDGSQWCIQTHHMVSLDVTERTPLPAGARYGKAAGVAVGTHPHTHFEFKVGHPRTPGADVDFRSEAEPAPGEEPEVLHLDPWMLFWQIFEDARARKRALHVAQEPVAPAATGEPVAFSAHVDNALAPLVVWTFGDGATALGSAVSHAFARPGVYAVAVTVLDGAAGSVRATQHIVVRGEAASTPSPVLRPDDGALDEPSFIEARPGSADVYGEAPSAPHTLWFTLRPDGTGATPRELRVINLGGGTLPLARPTVEAAGLERWVAVDVLGEGNEQRLRVSLLPELPHGWHFVGRRSATVRVRFDGCEEQAFRIVAEQRPVPEALPCVTVDDLDAGFFATPYFWTAGRGVDQRRKPRGVGGRYYTNGGRAAAGEFCRFTPDLAAGRYEVRLAEVTPYDADAEFDVRIRHAGGDTVLRVRPSTSRSIGVFDFAEGREGFAEIRAEGSQGLVLADAVEFRLNPFP